MSHAFIGVGSNEGDRLAQISRAIRSLGEIPDVHVVQMATILETEPVGGPPQGPYLNTVVKVDTSLEPDALLRALQAIERQGGRQPAKERWAPRPIDLDILLYDQRVIQHASLTIPHPRIHERRFVLEPLAQLAPDLQHPILKRSIFQLLEQLSGHSTAP